MDDDPDSNDELDYDPDDNVELVQIEKKFYCHQCATETTLTYQFLKREDGTWICKPCLEKWTEHRYLLNSGKTNSCSFGVYAEKSWSSCTTEYFEMQELIDTLDVALNFQMH